MSDASSLIDFVAQVNGEENLRVEENLGEGFVRLRVAEAERRQAKHDIRCVEDIIVEMLRNCRDAGAHHIFVATNKEDITRTIVMLDDGSGIPVHMQDTIFDARVTSKLETIHMDKWGIHGRGMALYSVRQNTTSAEVMSSSAGLGASIRVVVDTQELPEKKDQSTWPDVSKDEQGNLQVSRGPHNIIRTCCEFALEERSHVVVHVGSPAEIVAAIRLYHKPQSQGSDLFFIDNLNELPILDRIVMAADAQELKRVVEELGLSISERTLHRILAHQVSPSPNVIHNLLHLEDAQQKNVDLFKDRRGLKISKDDIDEFSLHMEREFSELASKYYLQLAKDPKVRVSKNRITVTFEIDNMD